MGTIKMSIQARSNVFTSEEGFSLLEVVAALAILSMALSYIFYDIHTTLKRGQRAYIKAYESAIAQSLMEEKIGELNWREGVETGTRSGLEFNRRISLLEEQYKYTSRQLYTLTVSVGDITFKTKKLKEPQQ